MGASTSSELTSKFDGMIESSVYVAEVVPVVEVVVVVPVVVPVVLPLVVPVVVPPDDAVFSADRGGTACRSSGR
jgi:hypothetical protein